MSLFDRILVGSLILVVGVFPVALSSENSPIMKLEDVIGIEIQKASLGERAVREGKWNGLVIGEDPESDFTLFRRFDPQYVDYTSIQVRVAKGGWMSSMMVIPNGMEVPPAVFVLDEECRYLTFPGNMPDNTDIASRSGVFYV